MLLAQRPQHDVVMFVDFARAKVDDEDTAATERRGNGPTRRTLCRRGGLGVQAVECRPRSYGVDIECDVPYITLISFCGASAHTHLPVN